ncbi:MAG: hypothetical protein ACOC2L_05755, partial [Candidatus Sumerlaeota bacterium]
ARSWDIEAFNPDSEHPPAKVFVSKDDPDYKALRKYLEAELNDFAKRTDYYQEGFVPAPFYPREMKRYGVLDKDWQWREPLDYFLLEERYYHLFYARRESDKN